MIAEKTFPIDDDNEVYIHCLTREYMKETAHSEWTVTIEIILIIQL